MRILFDQGTPAPLRKFLGDHQIETAYERGWSTRKNGELLQAAETAGCEVLVTTDMNLRYQQNLRSRTIAIVALGTTSWPRLQLSTERIAAAVGAAVPGAYIQVPIG